MSNFLDFNKQHFFIKVDSLSEIGGRSGKCALSETSKIGLKIAKVLFKLEVLANFTWTGKTNSKAEQKEQKIPFVKFERIVLLFFQTIKLACGEYHRLQNENFFKYTLLKHTSLRLKRLSK